MAKTLKLYLTDDLLEFINANCGDGTLYTNSGEFVRDLVRQKMVQVESEHVRNAIISGYQDAIAGRMVEFNGDLCQLMASRSATKS